MELCTAKQSYAEFIIGYNWAWQQLFLICYLHVWWLSYPHAVVLIMKIFKCFEMLLNHVHNKLNPCVLFMSAIPCNQTFYQHIHYHWIWTKYECNPIQSRNPNANAYDNIHDSIRWMYLTLRSYNHRETCENVVTHIDIRKHVIVNFCYWWYAHQHIYKNNIRTWSEYMRTQYSCYYMRAHTNGHCNIC